MTLTRLLLPIACFATLVACGDDGPSDAVDDDTGRSGVREVPDARVDVGTDVLVDDAFERPDLVQDTEDDAADSDADVDAAGDAEDADAAIDVPPPLPDIDSALALSVVEAGRDALDDYCSCDRCLANGFPDEATCRASALDGGFELNDCKVRVIEDLGLQAESYLRCMKAAFDAARDCTPTCSTTECLACDTNFGRAWSACQREFPTPYAALRDCDAGE